MLAAGLLAAVGLVLVRRLPKRLAVVVAGLALAAGLAGLFAYTGYTIATPHNGSIVTAGPAVDGGRGGPGGPMLAAYGPGGQNGDGGRGGPGDDGQGGGKPGGTGQGGQNGDGDGNDGSRQGGRSGDMGGLLNGQSVSGELIELVSGDAEDYTWSAATTGSQNASSFQLATGEAVMAIAGDMGKVPGGGGGTASQIAEWVADNHSSTTVDGVAVYDLSD